MSTIDVTDGRERRATLWLFCHSHLVRDGPLFFEGGGVEGVEKFSEA